MQGMPMRLDWYYVKGADKHGPVTIAKLRELAVVGQLLPSDLVWCEGMGEWDRAGKIAGLFDGVGRPQQQVVPEQLPAQAPPKRPPAPPKRPPAPPSNLYAHFVPVIQTAAGPPRPSPPLQQPLVDRMFQCPYCGREMVADPSMAGMAVACPHCGQH
ncbi:MAG TPA: GYF domain-containing protein, partial [Pirellulales bacterium]|nr:GYF domain-containing protein [Pirellulales bacterium]